MSKDDKTIYFSAFVQLSSEHSGDFEVHVSDDPSEPAVQDGWHAFTSAKAEFTSEVQHGIYTDLVTRYGEDGRKFIAHMFQAGLMTGLSYGPEDDPRRKSLH